eukprot:m.8522 g.8522  ORF g.8522 m.8522 type:complete len:110 (+) comp5465_c0_seq1:1792-2121(+)
MQRTPYNPFRLLQTTNMSSVHNQCSALGPQVDGNRTSRPSIRNADVKCATKEHVISAVVILPELFVTNTLHPIWQLSCHLGRKTKFSLEKTSTQLQGFSVFFHGFCDFS